MAVAYNPQTNKGILNHPIPFTLILCIVTIKLIPVKIEENPSIKAAIVMLNTALSVVEL